MPTSPASVYLCLSFLFLPSILLFQQLRSFSFLREEWELLLPLLHLFFPPLPLRPPASSPLSRSPDVAPPARSGCKSCESGICGSTCVTDLIAEKEEETAITANTMRKPPSRDFRVPFLVRHFFLAFVRHAAHRSMSI